MILQVQFLVCHTQELVSLKYFAVFGLSMVSWLLFLKIGFLETKVTEQ